MPLKRPNKDKSHKKKDVKTSKPNSSSKQYVIVI